MDLGDEVKTAVETGAPVVAVESSMINRGLPHPESLSAVREASAAIRVGGAVPAVIGILAGRIKVGMDEREQEALASANDVAKVSRRDLAMVIAEGGYGATTVASSMICAGLAGIPVFVTGGIGGVHRGFEATMDVSADLEELARTNVAVVCAGAKAILDLPRTLEYLETKGVPVLGYGTDDFPAYYAPSGLPVDRRFDKADAVARVMKAKWDLGIGGGVLVVNELAADDALDAATLDGYVKEALKQAEAEKVSGKAITPFVLERLNALSGGEVMKAGKSAVRNNAATAAAIAKAYAALRANGEHP